MRKWLSVHIKFRGFKKVLFPSKSSGVHNYVRNKSLLVIFAGASVEEVQELVEKHLRDLIVKNFDPKKADSIFTSSGQVSDFL